MKYPNHILLDISKLLITNSNQYWIFKHLNLLKKNITSFNNFTSQRKYLLRRESILKNKLVLSQKKFTIKYSEARPSYFLSDESKKFYLTFFNTKSKVKNRELYSKQVGKEIFDFLKNPSTKFNEKYLKRLLTKFSYNSESNLYKSNLLWSLFDINFIKKEKIYTKLKYSRVPQYDIVSGGVAALFAGFLGFLICEKFGFELPDSGDFYFLFIYFVFLFFFLRLFLKIMDGEQFSWNIISFKWLICFYQTLVTLFIKKIYFFYNRMI